MKQEALRNFPYVYLTVASLLLFFIAFVAFAFKTYSKRAKGQMQAAAMIPLEEGIKYE